jgi:hypothetical protein
MSLSASVISNCTSLSGIEFEKLPFLDSINLLWVKKHLFMTRNKYDFPVLFFLQITVIVC